MSRYNIRRLNKGCETYAVLGAARGTHVGAGGLGREGVQGGGEGELARVLGAKDGLDGLGSVVERGVRSWDFLLSDGVLWG